MDKATEILGEIFKDYNPLHTNNEPSFNVCLISMHLGEAARVVVEHGGLASGMDHLKERYMVALREELIQVAAIAVAAIETLDKVQLKKSEDNKNATQTIKY